MVNKVAVLLEMMNRRWQLQRRGSLGLLSPFSKHTAPPQCHRLHYCFENMNSILFIGSSVLKALNVISIIWFNYISEMRKCGVLVYHHTGELNKHFIYIVLKYLQCKYQLILNLTFLLPHHLLLLFHQNQEENPQCIGVYISVYSTSS